MDPWRLNKERERREMGGSNGDTAKMEEVCGEHKFYIHKTGISYIFIVSPLSRSWINKTRIFIFLSFSRGCHKYHESFTSDLYCSVMNCTRQAPALNMVLG